MSLQIVVEYRHRHRRHNKDVLSRKVEEEVWADLPVDIIQWVLDQILIVHQFIVDSGIDNINVEERRGRCNIAVAPE
jgi:hypothetical protein